MDKHQNSHIVYIRRFPQFASAARRELEEFFAEDSRGIGSYYAKGSVRTGTGLTPTEEKILMPYILNIDATERDFVKQVNQYFEELSCKVPAKAGLELEIGLTKDNSKPLKSDKDPNEENLPINIGNYIIYRWVLGHPWVSGSEAEGFGNQLKQYYIYDPALVSKVAITNNEQKDTALGYYLAVKSNKRHVDMYLTLLGVRTSQLSEGEQVIELRRLVDQKPKEFIDVYNDRDKEIKYVIEDMINNKVLERIGKTRIVIPETQEELGRDMKEAVLFLKDNKNTKTYNALKARLQEAWKKTSVSRDTDEDLLKDIPPVKDPSKPPIAQPVAPDEAPAKEIIPAAASEENIVAEPGSAGDIDE